MMEPQIRNPKAEASALLPQGYEARVLEPSPPANTDPNWFADDPTDPGDAGGKVVTPIPGEGTTWRQLAKEHPEISEFASTNWLDGTRRLRPIPSGYEMTRQSLHQLAFFVIAPARYGATAKMGLRFTLHGFGTPFFGDNEQIRVETGRLVHQKAEDVRSIEPETLAEACEFLGIPYEEVWFEDFHDPLAPMGPTAPLEIKADPAQAIGDWLGFVTLALERIRRTPGADDVSRVQLWPEHFDPAFEMGSYEKGHRASYGASPGDAEHPEPYLYVAAWGEVDRSDEFWNDTTFNGASLSYKEILEADDQIDTALTFYRGGYEHLTRAKS